MTNEEIIKEVILSFREKCRLGEPIGRWEKEMEFTVKLTLALQKKELLEKIEKYGCNEKNCQEGHYPISYNEENDETEWGGCPNCTSGGIRLEPYKTVDDIIRIIKEI